jgi:hypothetical protein
MWKNNNCRVRPITSESYRRDIGTEFLNIIEIKFMLQRLNK